MTGRSYFEHAYAQCPDPWQLSQDYELRKYALTVASLPRATYARGFEPGCSVGVLTEMLVQRCELLICTDVIEAPVATTALRVPRADVRQGAIPDDWPDGSFDLIVLSEVLYYLSEQQRRDVLRRAHDSLEPGGHLVAVHWRHPFEEAECTGDTVHEELRAGAVSAGWRLLVEHVEDDFRLEVYESATI